MADSRAADEAIVRMSSALAQSVDELSRLSAEWVSEHEVTYRQLVPHERILEDSARCMRHVLGEVADQTLPRHLLMHPEAFGARSARSQVPLEAVLRVLRADYRVLWEAMLGWAEDQQRDYFEHLLTVGAGRVWDVVDRVSVRVADAYRANDGSSQVSLRTRELAFAEAVLGGKASVASIDKTAGQLGFFSPGRFVLAAVGAADSAEFEPDRVQARLASARVRSVWVRSDQEMVGILSLHGKDLRTVQQTLLEHAQAPIGLGRVVTEIGDLARTRWQSRTALSTAQVHGSGLVVAFDDNKLEALVMSAPQLCATIAEDVLGPLHGLREGDLDRLLTTVEVYLEGSGSATVAAPLLHVHRNTVINRVRQFEELTGRSLRRPQDVVEVFLALRAHRLLEAPDVRPLLGPDESSVL
jgi:hypothetical protein